MDNHALAWLGKRNLNNYRIFSQLIPGYEVRALCKIDYKNCILISQPDNCIIVCLLNTTHYCTTNFVSGTVEKEANGNDTFCFLNFEFV